MDNENKVNEDVNNSAINEAETNPASVTPAENVDAFAANELASSYDNIEAIQTENSSSTSSLSNDSEEQGVTNNFGEGNSNGEPPKGNAAVKVVLTILIIAVVALIGACAVVFGGFGKSKGDKFVDMLTDDYIFDMPLEMAELSQKDGNMKSEISIDMDKLITQIIGYDDVQLGTLELVQEQVKKDDDISANVAINISDKEIATAKIVKTDELYGITIPDLMSEYIAVENNNLKALAKKLGVESGEIPDKITSDALQDKTTERYLKIFEEYKPILAKEISDYISTEKEINVEIKDETISTTRHTLAISHEVALKISKVILEKAKNDKDLYQLMIDNEMIEDYTFEEWKSEIVTQLETLNKDIEAGEFEPGIIKISAYQNKGNTIAIEIKAEELENDSNVLIRLSAINEKDSSYIELKVAVDGEDTEIKIISNIKENDSKYDGDIAMNVATGSYSINIDLLNFGTESVKDSSKELEKISKENSFVLNDKSEDEINQKLEEISEDLPTYLQLVSDRLPAEIASLLSGSSNDDYNYDDSYDYNYDDSYDYDYDDSYDYNYDDYTYDTTFELTGTQVEVLDDFKAKYNNISLGMSKADVINLMGQPDADETYSVLEFVDWEDETFSEYTISVVIQDDKVAEKSMDVYSDSYNNVKLSAELNSSLTDLETKITSIEEGMSLSEVYSILGNECVETMVDIDGYHEYTWYDVDENYVSISFDENNNAYYVGMVFGSY